ncbi:hypothetical protein BDV19DRAFT_384210 [Aspergillus venezuelensis]
MSGLEVVGVVLGALPLMIAAIDKYKTTSQRLKFFRFKEPFIVELIQALKEQQFFLETDLLVTLQATDLDKQEISDLLAKPAAKLFEDPDIVSNVQKYLGDGYGPYTAAVARCERILFDIAKHIRGLTSTEADGLAEIVGRCPVNVGRYEITKKIKFSLDKEDLHKRIKELNDVTERLRRVRECSVLRADVTLETTSRAAARYASTLKAVREYAHRLYKAISVGYVNGCHDEHETFLFLRSRSEAMDKRQQKSLKQTPVQFQLAFPPTAPTSKASVSCHITEVKVKHEDGRSESMMDCANSTSTVVKIVLPATKQKLDQQQSQINDLCQSVSKAWQDGNILDMYLTPAGCLSCHNLPRKVSPQYAFNWADVLSLDQILQAQSHPQGKFPTWTLNQRMSLSFNIASSVLQLYTTHWVAEPLTSKSIHFAESQFLPSIISDQQFTIAPKPFIIHKFSNSLMTNTDFSSAKRSLLDLGIVLLELWHFRTFELFAADLRMSVDESFGARYEVARRWLDESAYFMLPFYLDVVTRCIECTFGTSGSVPHWDDIVFRKSVCEYVLRPLWENCRPEFR